MYDGTVVLFINSLKTLANILKKAEEHSKANNIAEKDIVEGRLIPDMRDLAFQIQTASNTAKNTLPRLIDSPSHPMDDNETTFAELQERIAKTLTILNGVKRADFDSIDPETEIKVKMGSRGDVPFTKVGYVQKFALPNFYFHTAMAYAILRAKGVDVGKQDFLSGGFA
jgi:hypothetical protein